MFNTPRGSLEASQLAMALCCLEKWPQFLRKRRGEAPVSSWFNSQLCVTLGMSLHLSEPQFTNLQCEGEMILSFFRVNCEDLIEGEKLTECTRLPFS